MQVPNQSLAKWSACPMAATQYKIRVAGIDAPEKAQPFGQRAKSSMSELVFGKDVEVVAGKHDR